MHQVSNFSSSYSFTVISYSSLKCIHKLLTVFALLTCKIYFVNLLQCEVNKNIIEKQNMFVRQNCTFLNCEWKHDFILLRGKVFCFLLLQFSAVKFVSLLVCIIDPCYMAAMKSSVTLKIEN